MDVIEAGNLKMNDFFRSSLRDGTVYRCTDVSPNASSVIGEPWCMHGEKRHPIKVVGGRTVFKLSRADVDEHEADHYPKNRLSDAMRFAKEGPLGS